MIEFTERMKGHWDFRLSLVARIPGLKSETTRHAGAGWLRSEVMTFWKIK
jgi:hypothetical protein